MSQFCFVPIQALTKQVSYKVGTHSNNMKEITLMSVSNALS